uniref:SS18 N-terminal domain-containing protein n=1 Tax=Tetradesmus obliquus TaxID=3088 RepID=A0A383WI71_TETOB|eukprot:jgi/Sobl393_1/17386/SZX76839.1
MAQPQQPQLTTQQIQQKLEENHDFLCKIVAANQRSPQGLDPGTQAQVEQWSSRLQQNLMELAGQADKSTAGTGQQPAAAAQSAQSVAPPGISPQK